MPSDPLNTPGTRPRSIFLNGIALGVVAITLTLILAWSYISATGVETVVRGTVVRIEQIGTRQLLTRTVVRLANGSEAVVLLPSRTTCSTGSAIRIIQRDNSLGRTFHAALVACAN